jgi:glutamate racemase
LDKLREEFPQVPIVGTVPVVKTAAEQSKNKKIGILSTVRTAKSQYQKDLIERFAGECEVVNIGIDKLVPLIEKGDKSSIVRTIELMKILEPFKKAKIDVLALGCSHFPLVKDQIQKVLGSKVLVLDSGAAIARQVKRVLQSRIQLAHLSGKPQHEFFTTGDSKRFSEILASIGYNRTDVKRF